ncbi:unnamed protein product [Orchesella dallaii]|uniref:Uncharacterized protein n=1 Tax=Orchesella dallaii TaxID=48710 RepID=A0ABP1R8A5_9HEXA
MHSIYGMRKRCSHNLRIRLSDGSLPCLVCVCAEIDDSLITECNGNRKLSSACINDIIHRFRIINSVLDDVPIQPNTIEEHLSPVLRTSIAVLKIDNDEVGTLVSQALDKICPKVPMYMLEKFLGDLSAQILEKTTFGNLESLSVLIRRKECLNCFLKFHGQQLLPKLFQVLKKHAENYSCFKNTVLLETNNSVANSTTNKNSSLKVLGKTVETLEAICSRDVLFVADREHESLQFESETFSVLFEYLKDVISSCMKLLNSTEITNMPAFSAKILSFLDRLLQYAETLRCLVANNLDVPFCSMIKKLLFNRSLEVKSAVLSVVHQMILTYMHTMGDEKAEKGLIADFPSVIFQVDLIHFITEAMNMSSGIAFITTLQILDKISLIPVFQQGRMIPVLESILRVSSISSLDHGNDMSVYESLNSLIANILRTMEPITPGIQFQLLHLFERLPSEWTTLQFLPWIKLLYFCREVELLSRLWSILIIFVERNKNVGSCYCVSSLKCFLLIAFAVMNCKCPDDTLVEDNAEVSQQEALINKIMSYLMDVSFLPSLLALITYGTSEDSEYVSIILELMINFPVDKMKPFKAFGVPNQTVFKIIFDSEISGDVMPDVNEDPEYEIKADSDLLENRDGVWWWSPKCYLHLLACIRQNLEFM